MKKRYPLIVLLFVATITMYSQIPTNGLVGHYELNNGSYADSSPSGLDLESVGLGGALLPVEDRFGQVDQALLYIDEYMDLASNPDAFNFDSDSNFSLAVWMKIEEDIIDWTGLLNNWNGAGAGGYFLGINPTQGVRWNVNGPLFVDSGYIPTGEWTHVAATYNGADAILYINGESVGSAANNVPIIASPLPFTVAAQADLPTLQFPGTLDDILVYERALTAQEVMDIFSTLSIEDVDALSSNIIVSPNPAESTITISYDPSFGTITSYELLDLQGRTIRTNKITELTTTLNLNVIQSGMYLLKIQTMDGKLISKKIIKK